MNKETIWEVAPQAPAEWRAEFPEINDIILQLLYNRNLKTQSEIEDFLTPDYSRTVFDPFLFHDMKKAVKRIWQAIVKKEKIVIFGDYDADGVCSSVILADWLQNYTTTWNVVIPHRSKEGYGLTAKAVKNIINQNPKVLITLDCGSTNVKEVKELADKGIDVIIVDHHHEPEKLPRPFAFLNCALKKETYPTKNLSAGGMTYKLIQALFKYGRELNKVSYPEGWEKWYLDLVSIATVADMVPLLGENRSLVKYGLLVLNKTKREGLKSLINLTGLKFGRINERHLGFVIGPRINAAGRMQHARGAFDLLMAKDKDKAKELSLLLQEDNSLRQKTTEDYLNQARVLLEDQIKNKKKILFLYKPEWNLGLVGLVAGKILEEYNRPVLIMSEVDGQIKGSGRSVKGFHITEALEQVSKFLKRFGGHAGACGFTLKDKKYLISFQDKLIKIAEDKISEEEFVPVLRIDSLIKLKEVDWKLFEDLEKFSPYGQDVPVPRFLSEKLEVVNIEGVGLEQKHLRIFVKDENGTLRKTIAFGFGSNWRDKIKLGDYLDLVYEVDVNEWNGNRELQLKVIDLKLR